MNGRLNIILLSGSVPITSGHLILFIVQNIAITHLCRDIRCKVSAFDLRYENLVFDFHTLVRWDGWKSSEFPPRLVCNKFCLPQ